MLRVELRDGPLPLLVPAGDAAPRRVRVAFATRRGGLSAGAFASLNVGGSTGDEPGFVEANVRRLGETLGVPAGRLYSARQVHGTALLRVRAADRPEDFTGRDADILVTDAPGAHLLMKFADCLPVVVWSDDPPVVGVAHCGWRGLVDGAAEKLVTALTVEWGLDPARLCAALGPAICFRCFAVGLDVARRFRDRFAALPGIASRVELTPTGGRVDLAGIARDSLAARGIPASRIADAGLCTACHPELFFSHRRDKGRTGRLACVAGIKEAS